MAKGEEIVDAVDEDAVPAVKKAAGIVIDESPNPDIDDPINDATLPTIEEAASAGMDVAEGAADRLEALEALVNSLADRITEGSQSSGEAPVTEAEAPQLLEELTEALPSPDPVPWTHRSFFRKGY